MKDVFICESLRLQRFLYSLGFEKQSIYIDGKEQWVFEKNPELQECLDFYFNFRKKRKNIEGVNEYASNTKS